MNTINTSDVLLWNSRNHVIRNMCTSFTESTQLTILLNCRVRLAKVRLIRKIRIFDQNYLNTNFQTGL